MSIYFSSFCSIVNLKVKHRSSGKWSNDPQVTGDRPSSNNYIEHIKKTSTQNGFIKEKILFMLWLSVYRITKVIALCTQKHSMHLVFRHHRTLLLINEKIIISVHMQILCSVTLFLFTKMDVSRNLFTL